MALDRDTLLKALSESDGWTESKSLAERFGVTTRTIRNHVSKINEEVGSTVIESSYRGYRIAPSAPIAPVRDTRSTGMSPEERQNDLLRRILLESSGVSVYDLAEEYFVSPSTIETDLREIRLSVASFGLNLSRRRDNVSITGSERDKRRLMGKLVSLENPEGFTAQTGSSITALGFDTGALTRITRDAMRDSNLSCDDFGINNVIIHLVVMVSRIRSGNAAPYEESAHKLRGTNAHHAASLICHELSKLSHLTVDEGEVDYLALVVASNSRNDGTLAEEASLSSIIGDRTTLITKKAIRALEEAYHLEPFDEDFVTRISIHIHGLMQRGANGMGMHNPLTEQIKSTYPLIYDMAVYLAEQLADVFDGSMSEDEIALLAFHIGAYMEKSSSTRSRVSCDLLYIDYLDMGRIALNKVEAEFPNDVEVAHIVRASDFDASTFDMDFVITPVAVPGLPANKQVIVHPLLTDGDLRKVGNAIAQTKDRMHGDATLRNVERFLSPELFHNEYYRDTSAEMIESLAAECVRKGYCDEDFCEQVLQRERLSPTEFHNRVAMPHTLSAIANRSFLATVINRRPMRWHNDEVNIIFMVGIAEHDRDAFRQLFDSLLEVLSEPANVNQLIASEGYDDFAARLSQMIRA